MIEHQVINSLPWATSLAQGWTGTPQANSWKFPASKYALEHLLGAYLPGLLI